MDAFTDFIMTVNYPPNPYRNLDDTMPASLTVPSQSGGGATATGNPNTGRDLFINTNLDGGVFTCNTCHALPVGTTTNLFNGNLENETQDFKIPQLRNMYEKVGFNVIRPNLTSGNAANIGTSTQKKGFGFIHDGAVSLTEFLAAPVFQSTTQQERDLFAFMLAFPTESAPAIGRQVTVTPANKNDSTVTSTIATLVAQAELPTCDLIVRGVVGGVAKGWVYDPSTDTFEPDSLLEAPVSESALRSSLAGADVVTYTGVPPGSGVRLGIDRDRDTFRDRTETFLGTDPAIRDRTRGGGCRETIDPRDRRARARRRDGGRRLAGAPAARRRDAPVPERTDRGRRRAATARRGPGAARDGGGALVRRTGRVRGGALSGGRGRLRLGGWRTIPTDRTPGPRSGTSCGAGCAAATARPRSTRCTTCSHIMPHGSARRRRGCATGPS
jgi:hypothetical protein